MAINGISGISGIGGISAAGASTGTAHSSTGGFSELLASLGQASAQADQAVGDLATGGDRDLHDVVLAVEMESVAFDLAVQIRNRLLDAYSEIFRMQV
jgi:flagellar hook-basal body complex protein FliE